MSDNSGSSGILGVIVGVALVLGIGYFFFSSFNPSKKSVDVTIKAPEITAPVKNN